MLLLPSSSYLYSWKCFIDDFSVPYSLKVVAAFRAERFFCLFVSGQKWFFFFFFWVNRVRNFTLELEMKIRLIFSEKQWNWINLKTASDFLKWLLELSSNMAAIASDEAQWGQPHKAKLLVPKKLTTLISHYSIFSYFASDYF